MTILFLAPNLEIKDGWSLSSKLLIEQINQESNSNIVFEINASNKDYRIFSQTNSFKKLFYLIKAYINLYPFLKKLTAIHACIEPLAPLAYLASLISKKPYTITIHGTYACAKNHGIWSKLFTRSLLKADCIISPSNYTVEKAQITHLSQIKVIPWASRFASHETKRQFPKEPLFICIGEIKQRKGIIEAINVFQEIIEVLSSARLLIIGNKLSTKYFKQVIDLIKKLNLNEKITIRSDTTDQ